MVKKNIKFSIVVPMYKTADYFERCLTSILEQEYKNYEIVLVDDGSPDCCGVIADRYVAENTNIKVIHKSNGGLDSARKAGLQICEGDYVVFLDHDDILVDNALYKASCRIAELNAETEILQMAYVMKFADGQIIRQADFDKIFGQNEIINGQEWLCNHLQFHNGFFNVWSKIYKRSFLQSLNLQVMPKFCMEDVIFMTDCFARAKSVSYVDVDLIMYTVGRQGAITTTVNTNYYKAHLFSFKKSFENIFKSDVEKDKKNIILQILACNFFNYCIETSKLSKSQIIEINEFIEDGMYILKFVKEKNLKRNLFCVLIRLVGFKNACLLVKAYKKEGG